MRLALARLLLEENDLLLLDEPTNHLDLAAREWLEEHLAAVGAAYVIVSHDRRFLDAVATKVVRLDRGEIGVYPGNYSAFRRQLGEKIGADRAVYEKRRMAVWKLKKQARAYHEWSNAKEKEKRGAFDKGFVGARAAKLMKRSLHARNRLEGTIEEMENERPFEGDAVRVDFHGSRGRTLLAAEGVSVGFDLRRPLAKEVSFVLGGGDRLAVSGPNGSGKTTLLRTVLGEVPPLAGRARVSSSASVGYFDQENRRIKPEAPALRAVVDAGCDETLARTVLGRMRVRRDTVRRRFGDLSAGERAKVLLTVLVLGDHNLLVLDEPTNHLDVETQDVLLEALANFPVGILFVSHDRHFVETLATEALHLQPPRTAVAPGYRSKP